MSSYYELDRAKIASRIDAAARELIIDGRPASNRQIAELVIDRSGIKITQESIRQYRAGTQWCLATPEIFSAFAEVIGRTTGYLLFGVEDNNMHIDLTQDERNLIAISQTLPPDLRAQLLGFARGLLAQLPTANIIPLHKPRK